MRKRLLSALIITCMASLLNCATSSSGQVFTLQHPVSKADGQWRGVDVPGLLAANPLAEDENIQMIPIKKTQSMSQHLVRIRDREKLHLHKHHELSVYILKGQGTLKWEEAEVKVGQGDFVTVARNTAHAYINQGKQPSVLFVQFSPPYESEDKVILMSVKDLLK